MKRHLCGIHAVREALVAHPRDIVTVYSLREQLAGTCAEIVTLAQKHKVPVEVRSAAELDALARGVRHQGVIAVAGNDYPYLDLDALLARCGDPALMVALDEITDPHNFGAIVRSCVALGADGVITLKDRAVPVTSTVVRASAGATEHCAIARVTNLARTLETLRSKDLRVVGLDADGTVALEDLDLTSPLTLVVGSEGSGLRRLVREGCDVLARLPLAGPIASLNASVAASIALYEVGRQRRHARGASR